ncbi:aliphatic sulfonate ABC transporter substrate-binding protein [Commensalibacter nepenthis]|uniref:Aliphatic sulfonate ABC transporter substrate-binding protein n=1 Tax=Commensalibacter nepenthis TaxID=3043872 RepID=A0ABT6QAB1_9PROT|nr:aliphatic sulfonate ABC transporter substrate-binding protein [Commensalibacter sp. TBRC 10068]MDI2113843.1 aliphatic sulfonate ABC transporter substrate-binding protein [Commensalibacter sp. TBRC 10068]
MFNRRQLIIGALTLSLISKTQDIFAQGVKTIRVGYQSCDPLDFLRNSKIIVNFPVQIVWSRFTAGPQLLQALLSGSIDIGEVGDTPPIFAQSSSNNFVYIAQEPPSPKSEAIITHASSNINDLYGLKGKKIAVTRGSNAHWLLIATLKKIGLSIKDVQPVFLPPAIAQSAFNSQNIDAWAIWDPFLAIAQQNDKVRTLTTGENIVENRTFYIGNKNFVKNNPQLTRDFISYISKNDQLINQNKTAFIQYLKDVTGLSTDVLDVILSRYKFGATLIQPNAVVEQQQIADSFFNQNLIPKKINVQDNVWEG